MSSALELNRRQFLCVAGAALYAGHAWAGELPRDVRITRIVAFDLRTRRPKYIGKNSRRDDHGIDSSDRMVRVYTDAGIDGLGTSSASRESCQAVLGRRLSELYRPNERLMVGPFGRNTSPYWDLAGKLLGKPVYELLGGAGPRQVPAYDGSIYFIDLIAGHASDYESEFKRQLDLGLQAGHRAFKLKVGRGAKWMLREEGDARDVAVVKLTRRHVGPKVLLGIDANDGYNLPRTRQLMKEIGDLDIAFIEEMIPVKPDRFPEYVELRQFLREQKLDTLIADGENHGSPDEFRHWVEAKAVDILQGDMNQFGFEDILTEAGMGRGSGARVAPHNWGSLVGYYLQLQVGRAIPNFYRAEEDPLSSPALIAEGYSLKDGLVAVPDAPGLGLRIDEARFTEGAKVLFDIKI